MLAVELIHHQNYVYDEMIFRDTYPRFDDLIATTEWAISKGPELHPVIFKSGGREIRIIKTRGFEKIVPSFNFFFEIDAKSTCYLLGIKESQGFPEEM